MARIAGVDIPREKRVEISLRYIYGVGPATLGVLASANSFLQLPLGFATGYVMDRWLGTSPWFLLGGLLVGLVVGFYELAKAVCRL